jgi:hypothetical protein
MHGSAFYVVDRVVRKDLLRANPRGDSWRRVAYDSTMRYASMYFSIPQMKSLSPPTRTAFEGHLKGMSIQGAIEEIGESAALLWLDTRAKSKTLLYFHGG